ncbi:exodeoxyribonuclease VII large subunit [Xiamenia xianingshaonis]|uniref:Exodeoxyribonuclease 7 large subunit n=1 Tax=Xiamenia xianingshaonis TaxID=2682776 RepID=A0A9E6MRI8_9ACTN|nr:exodeoxyribonuclease VII large subunit [Xiamenia xianingshaonis]NHM13665.1 exodeoxyribonuclease VII large subunit [Xiamenia xianingshaonis]QTU85037.1 exodeoxyribonuclease VII large subunit [Xiamenia xianingshaonis]
MSIRGVQRPENAFSRPNPFQPVADGSDADGPAAGASKALSVSAAVDLAKGALEGIQVTVLGEVSEFSNRPGYKAVYFTVKDERATLPCMMWTGRYRACGVDVCVGQKVEMTGRFSVYAPKGRMNFDVQSLSLAGEGRLRMEVANLARRLEAEGHMAPSRKRPIPVMPEVIGIVTSPRGSVVHDMLRTLRRRFPLSRVVVAGVPVEGPQAARAMMTGLRAAYDAGAEVILLGRGGGSFEDLMPFNDEKLAITISRCPVPVITGIGHEPDTTIADMVADLRASTPTAAAEAASPAREALEEQFSAQALALGRAVRTTVSQLRSHVAHVATRPVFQDPQALFATDAQTLDYATSRMARALSLLAVQDRDRVASLARRMAASIPRNLERDRSALTLAQSRLAAAMPATAARAADDVERAGDALFRAADAELARFGHNIALRAARLHDLSPLAVLARGYAVARDEAGGVVKSVDAATVGSPLFVSVSDGTLHCTVDAVEASRHPAIEKETA